MGDQTKPWWQSKTIWAGIGTVLASVLMLLGATPADIADAHAATGLVGEIVTAGLGLLTIVGRLVARHKIAGSDSSGGGTKLQVSAIGMVFALGAALVLALSVGACSPGVPGSAPSSPGNAVTIDERSAIAIETAYTAASLAGQRAVQAGLLDRDTFKAADDRAWAAVLVERDVYAAGNAPGLAQAAANAGAAVADLQALIAGAK